MKRVLPILLILLLGLPTYGQKTFRKGIFLHHSTGRDTWGNARYETSGTPQVEKYNYDNKLTGDNQVAMDLLWFPNGDNEWYIVRSFFEGRYSYKPEDYLKDYDILMIKSCYPSSDMANEGGPGDTAKPDFKSVYNYKWHWRAIIKWMEQHPDKFFIIWTNAPLVKEATNASSAALSKSFSNWAKNILAKGLDPEYGAFPKNVYVFDFFSKLTDADGYLKDQYKRKEGDSHPNEAASALVAPQLVKEIFDAALAYEKVYNGTGTGVGTSEHQPMKFYPNPAKQQITIEPGSETEMDASISITNICGQQLYSKAVNGSRKVVVDVSAFPKGIYMLTLNNGSRKEMRKLLIQ